MIEIVVKKEVPEVSRLYSVDNCPICFYSDGEEVHKDDLGSFVCLQKRDYYFLNLIEELVDIQEKILCEGTRRVSVKRIIVLSYLPVDGEDKLNKSTK